jgi:DNA-binding NtrC family response regulator
MNSAYTILVVDDEESLVKLATHVLEMRGYRVLSASHGENALRLAADFPDRIHVLLTDVKMDPYMSGCVLAQHLRPSRPDMRIVYMSSYPASEIVRKEVEHGNASLLRKPFTPTGLLEKVKSVLEEQEAHQG